MAETNGRARTSVVVDGVRGADLETGEAVEVGADYWPDGSETPPAPKALAAKMARIAGALGKIEKKGQNQHFGYRYIREPDLVEALVKHLAEESVFIFPEVLRIEEVRTVVTGRNAEQYVTRVWVRYLLVDGESGESVSRTWVGDGMDGQDKGLAKALTGAEKTFLLKTFLVAGGDATDPDADAGRDSRGSRSSSESSGGSSDGGARKATAGQMRGIFARARELSIEEEDLRTLAKVESMKDLSYDGAVALIQALDARKKAAKKNGSGSDEPAPAPEEGRPADEDEAAKQGAVAETPAGPPPSKEEVWKRLLFLFNDDEGRIAEEFERVVGRTLDDDATADEYQAVVNDARASKAK